MKAGPVVFALLLAACGARPSPTVAPSAHAPSDAASGSPATSSELGDVPWMSAQRTWNADEVPLAEYTLLAGILDEPDPSVSLQVSMAPMVEPYEVGRAPAAGIGQDGSIAYVADDGTSSEVHLLSIAGGTDAVVAELPQVVWSLAVAPDGGAIYLLVMDRATGADAGVATVRPDGGPPTVLMAPAQIVARESGNLLAAVVAFQGALIPSMDGALLARRVCSWMNGPLGCALDVVDLASGQVRSFARAFGEQVIGLGDGMLVTGSDCSMELCSLVVTEVSTGAQQTFDGPSDGAAVTLLDGRLLIAEAVRTIRPATSVVWLTWPESGERRQLLRAGGETLFYLGGLLWHAALPPGWLLVQVSEPSGILAVRAADGSSVDLVQPHLDMPRPPAAVGSAG